MSDLYMDAHLGKVSIKPCSNCFNSTIQFLTPMGKKEFMEHITALIGGCVFACKLGKGDDEAIREMVNVTVEGVLKDWEEKYQEEGKV